MLMSWGVRRWGTEREFCLIRTVVIDTAFWSRLTQRAFGYHVDDCNGVFSTTYHFFASPHTGMDFGFIHLSPFITVISPPRPKSKPTIPPELEYY
jgi:hypothetical protein